MQRGRGNAEGLQLYVPLDALRRLCQSHYSNGYLRCGDSQKRAGFYDKQQTVNGSTTETYFRDVSRSRRRAITGIALLYSGNFMNGVGTTPLK